MILCAEPQQWGKQDDSQSWGEHLSSCQYGFWGNPHQYRSVRNQQMEHWIRVRGRHRIVLTP